MIQSFCFVIILGAAYALSVSGLFSAFVMCCNVLLAGIITFNFFEPLSRWMENTITSGTVLEGYEDMFVMIPLFSLTLGLLRLLTNTVAPKEVEMHPIAQKAGGAAFGLLTGYLVAGFLVCAFQTLPWHKNFMYFDHKHEPDQVMRLYFPPDKVWLAMMNRAGDGTFYRGETFDKHGTYELRYARYRRYNDEGNTISYTGEFDRLLGE